MSKVFITLFVGFVTFVSFQNCAKIPEQKEAVYVLASKEALGENNPISGADYYIRDMASTSSAQLSTSMIPAVFKTKVDINLKKNEISISKYELSDGGWDSRVYEVKTCDLVDHRMFGYFKSEMKKIKICTYVSTATSVDYSKCSMYAPTIGETNLASLRFYINITGVARLSLSEDEAPYYPQYDPNCDLTYTTYCNLENDAGRLEPVLDDILSEIESSDTSCKITNP